MSDRLEEFVRQNREQFDLHEPDPVIWLKINPTPVPLGGEPGRDDKARGKGRGIMRRLRIAATVALIFAGSTAGIYYLAGVRGETDQYGELYTEMQETEQYYSRMVAQRYNELRPYLAADPVADEMLKMDFEELDQVYAELKEDLKDNAANPDVIEAMILNYRVKLEILEDLLNQLKEKENQDDENKDSHSL
jgi:hypothetical protein